VKDIRSVVCPWWDRPYQQQLKSKMDTVLAGLKQITVEVRGWRGAPRGGELWCASPAYEGPFAFSRYICSKQWLWYNWSDSSK
jgi:hypothetical protein